MEQSNEVRLVLVGRTGTGRSSIGNFLLRKDFFRRCVSLVSVTEKCIRGETIRSGTKVTVVDTPGLFHTNMKQDSVKKEIFKCMDILSPGPHAFLCVFRISRHSTEEEQTLVELEDTFGEKFCKYCIVLFVTDNTTINTNIDEFLDTLPYFYRDLADKCSRRVVKFCAVEEYSDDMLLQIRRFQKEIAKQEPPYYSFEMVSKSQSRFDRVLFKPVKSIICWLKQRKKVYGILFVLFFVGGCYHFVCNSSIQILAEAT